MTEMLWRPKLLFRDDLAQFGDGARQEQFERVATKVFLRWSSVLELGT